MNHKAQRNSTEEPEGFERAMDAVLGVAFGQQSSRRRSGHGSAEAPDTPGAPAEMIGEFRIIRELGRGGMGVVYLAEDERLGRRVAVKVLTAFAAHSTLLRQRLKREAEAASRIDHPAICKVFGVGEAHGVPFITMQLVEGETLARRLAGDPAVAAAGADTPVTSSASRRADVMQAARLVEELARALHTAHESGLVHRDVKPGNIMVTPEGKPVLLDFGLVRNLNGEGPSLTHTGELLGTPAYMAPEQLRGGRVPVDCRADVYSLGVTLYECLTHRRPFKAPTREQLYSRIFAASPPDPRRLNPAIPRDLKVVLETALEKDPDRRYRNAAALADDLRRVRELEPIMARPISSLGRVVRWAQRRPARAALVLVLAIAVPALAGLAGFAINSLPAIQADRALKQEAAVERILELGFAELAHGSQEDAIQCFDEALELRPGLLEAIAGRCLALLHADRHEGCLALLKQDPDRLRDQPMLRSLQIDALARLGRIEEADRIEAELPSPVTAFECFLAGSRLMKDCWTQTDSTVFQRAKDWFLRAIVRSDRARPLYHFALAHVAEHVADHDLRLEVSEALPRRWKSSALAWRYSASVLLKMERLGAATRAAREAVALDPDLHSAYRDLSRALQRDGKFDEAVETLRQALARDPERPRTLCALAALRRNVPGHEDFPEAIRLLETALKREPENRLALHDLGLTYIRAGRWAEATATFRRLVLVAPDWAAAHVSLGYCHVARKRYREAAEVYGRVLAIDPENADALRGLGTARLRLGQSNAAGQALERSVGTSALDSGDPRALFNLGRAQWMSGRHDEAMQLFRRVVEIDRNHARARVWLAAGLDRAGQHREAMQQYHRALQLQPDMYFARLEYARVLERRGEIERASKEIRRALRSIPPEATAGARGRCGDLLLKLGRVQQAVGEYRAAVKKNERYWQAWVGLARALNRLGNHETAAEAAEAARKAIRLDSEEHQPRFQLGVALFHVRRFGEAEWCFRAAIRRGMTHPSVFCNLGLALVWTGKFKDALDPFARGHELGAANPDFRYPSREWLEACRRMVRLEAKLDPVIRGVDEPTSADEMVTLARIAIIRGLDGPAVRLFQAAFEREAKIADEREALKNRTYRLSAAHAAGRAAPAPASDERSVEAPERADWRNQALRWLREELVGLEEQVGLEATARKSGSRAVARTLGYWKTDDDFACWRDAPRLAKLPEPEQASWRAFWGSVDRVLEKAQSGAPGRISK